MDGNILEMLGKLQGGQGGDPGSLLGLLSLLNNKGNGKPGEEGGSSQGKAGPDLAQLFSLLKYMTPPENHSPAGEEEEKEVWYSPCAHCQEPCARAGFPLPAYEEAKNMARMWYGYGNQP